MTVEEARVEDRLRTADHVDPDVDTRTDDYRPTEPGDARRRTETDGRDADRHDHGTGETNTLDPQREDTRYRSDPA